MTAGEITTLIASITAAVTSLTASLIAFMAARTAAKRSDLLWERGLRDGEAAAIKSGVATKDSPTRPTAKVYSAFAAVPGLIAELRAFAASDRLQLSDAQFHERIEMRFGARMLKEVTKPMGENHNAMMAVAMAISKGEVPTGDQGEPEAAVSAAQ